MFRRAPLRRWSLATASAVTLLALAPNAASAQWSSLTFFGDSFTDMGMGDALSAIAGLPDPTPEPPYWPGPPPLNFPGTATNGPTWAAYFAELLGRPGDARTAMAPPGVPTGNNFAISGATTGFTNVGGDLLPVNIPGGVLPTGLLTQFGLFSGISPVPALIPPPPPRAIDPTGLYVIWAGVNDIRDFADAPPPNPALALQAAAANVAFVAQQLALGGARSFLIPRAPNSAVVPEVALDPATAALRATYTNQFNTYLDGLLAGLGLAFPTARIFTFDLDPIYADIQADAMAGGPKYGITNTTVPCFGVPALGVPASDCSAALFSDALHPTTRAQEIVGQVAAAAVVPEPATVVLLAGGLAALGAAGTWRRRRGAGRAA